MNYCSRCLGTHLMISSTRTIISAASVPDNKICCFTRKHSVTPLSSMSPTNPVRMSIPALVSPLPCDALSCEIISEESRPAFSQIIVGMARNAFANPSMASARFPGVRLASSSTALLMIISGHPPPYTIRLSLTVAVNTQSASCSDRSASPSTCEDAPRNTIVHASPFATPLNLISLSSPIMISSTKSHVPNTLPAGSSKVEQISPPVTSARRSTPSKSACSMDVTPLLINTCSG
mmetsp:Transcript_2277/g.8764  ORF Transcript_2277/g.8764 Transcript_2277/m.8764 type:complete len:235 (+) Transcript_2277:1530-2234(+)